MRWGVKLIIKDSSFTNPDSRRVLHPAPSKHTSKHDCCGHLKNLNRASGTRCGVLTRFWYGAVECPKGQVQPVALLFNFFFFFWNAIAEKVTMIRGRVPSVHRVYYPVLAWPINLQAYAMPSVPVPPIILLTDMVPRCRLLAAHGLTSCLSARTQPLTATGAPSQTSTIPYHTIPGHPSVSLSLATPAHADPDLCGWN